MSDSAPLLDIPDQEPLASNRPAITRRRSSAVGAIGLGDNAGPSLSTMPANPEQARASRRRIRALSGNTEMLATQSLESEAMSTATDKSQELAASRIKQQQATKSTRRQRKPKKISLIQHIWLSYRETAYQNSWFNPLILLLFFSFSFGLMSVLGVENNFLEPFFLLSYPIPGSEPVMYGKGTKDFCFVIMAMLFFTFFREFWMQVILRPLAISCGIRKKAKVSRFMEQTYSIVYYGLSGPFGLYIMYHTPIWYFKTTPFYVDFPHKTHVAMFKLFYLLQASFWAQQSVVLSLQLEKPRKDFYELVFHHVVTMALIFLSYWFHFTWIGLAVYITMDISDLFLAISKTLNYLNSNVTGPFFILFMGVWIYTRHYLNIRILYSMMTEFSTIGPYELNWETEQYKCFLAQCISVTLLMALQLVNCYWLILIFRVAYRFVFSGVGKDERSDDEDDEDDEEVELDDSSESSVSAGTDEKNK